MKKATKNKEKKKGKKKSAAKELKITQVKEQKQTKPGKLKESAKALRKEIERLTQELALRDKQLKGLIDASRADLELVSEAELLSQRLLDSSHTGSISERKKIWERHQYLRSCYEMHLAEGTDKAHARLQADRDLRERYGEEFGYTEEQLDSILT
ncbi:MAG: hypothetical protein KDI27_10770 [Gammaproteobacteria bacterium]|nr:hypothetical protein [Gammaproteobacteria bacterium]MCB1852486.1 hypothetical protein [Gammaproteobacteria bacterium]